MKMFAAERAPANPLLTYTVSLSCFLLPLYSFQASAQDEVIGRVLVTSGVVAAIDGDDNTRPLSRRSEIYLDDTIVTDGQGFAQIRMADGAIIALKEDTEFIFREFEFDGNAATPDSAVMEMVTGGFRTITGSISDGDDDIYRVETQFANIGVRGTSHEAVIAFGSLFTGVSLGGTTVSNEFGSLDTGVDGDFDFAVTNQGQAPQGLLQQPNQLGRIGLVTVNLDEEDDDGNAGGDGDNGGGDGNGDGGDNGGGGNQNNGGDDNGPNFDNLGGGGNQGGGNNLGNVGGGGNNANFNNAGNNNGGGGGDNTGTTPPPGGNTDQAINPLQNVRNASNITNPGQTVVDTDGDGVPDPQDAFPNDPTESRDTDGDGVGDNADAFPTNAAESADSDGDGVGDIADAFPNDPLEFLDTDGDGVGNNSDVFPNNPLESLDSDKDGVGDNSDPAPLDPTIPGNGTGGTGGDGDGEDGGDPDEDTDTDADIDSDGDGVLDSEDAFPLDPSESVDTDGDGVGDNADQFPLDPTRSQIVAVLSPTLLANIQNSGRRGFTLSRRLYETYEGSWPAIYRGAATDANNGDLKIIVDDINSGVVLPYQNFDGRSSQSYFVFDSTSSVTNNAIGLPDGILSRFGEFYHDVQWGAWGYPNLRAYTEITDDTKNYISIPEDVSLLWVSTQATNWENLPTEISTSTGKLFFGDQNFIGGAKIGSSTGGLTQFSGFIDFNLDSGNINDGWMEFCIGSLDCNEQADQRWEFDVEGYIEDALVEAWPTNGKINNESSGLSIEGVIDGIFTGDNAEALVGGFNLFSNISDSNLPSAIVDGVFLLEREERIDGGDIRNILDSSREDALLVQVNDNRNIFGQSVGIIEGDTDSLVFVEKEDFEIFTLGDGVNLLKNLNLSDDTGFNVLFQSWDGPIELLTNNYTIPGIPDVTSEISFFAGFNNGHIASLRGHFGNVLEIIGTDEDSQDLNLVDSNLNDFSFDFDVDFLGGTISNGEIDIQLYDSYDDYSETWNILFDGRVNEDGINIELGTGTLQITEYPNGPVSSDPMNLDGNIEGRFVLNNAEDNFGFVTSFYFRDESSETIFSDNFVSGVGLIGATNIENRFDNDAEEDLSRLGFLAPLGSDNQVYGALATTETSTPIFVDNTASVLAGDLFELPTYLDSPDSINYVFINGGATALDPLFIDGHDVILGEWKSGNGGNVKKLTNPLDPRDGSIYSDGVFWSSVGGSGSLDTPYINTTLTYGNSVTSNNQENKGFIGLASAGPDLVNKPIKDVEIFFDAAQSFLDIGTVSNGMMKVCAGGSDPSACTADSTIFELSFAGTYATNKGSVFSASVSDFTIKHPDGTETYPTLTGELEGVFTGIVSENTTELYDAFTGGFNLDNGSDIFLTGTFVVEREDRFNSSVFTSLNKKALVVDTLPGTSEFYTSTAPNGTTADDTGLYLFDTGNDVVIKYDADYVTNQGGNAAGVDGYGVEWGFWENALVATDNLVLGNPDATAPSNQPEPIWWAVFDPVKPHANLTGTYRSILDKDTTPDQLSFLGGESFDLLNFNDITKLDVEFDVDFSSAMVTNGNFFAEINDIGSGSDPWDDGTGSNVWNIDTTNGHGFSAKVEGGQLTDVTFAETDTNNFGVYEIRDSDHIMQYTGVINFAELNGGFINKTSSNVYDGQGFVGGFAFDATTNVEGTNKDSYLDGLFLAGIEDEIFTDFRSNPGYSEGAKGIIMLNDNSVLTGLTGNAKNFSNSGTDVTFINSSNQVYIFGETDDHSYYNSHYCCNNGNLEMGYWDDVGALFNYDSNGVDLGSKNDINDPVSWINFTPAVYTQKTGRFSSDNFKNFFWVDSNDESKDDVSYSSSLNFEFDVDFTSGQISNGILEILYGCSECVSTGQRWDASFGGDTNDKVANIRTPSGILLEGTFYDGYTTYDISEGKLVGDFAMEADVAPDYKPPHFAGLFNMASNAAELSIRGGVIVDGYIDERLNVNQLQSMDNHIGVLNGELYVTDGYTGSPLFADPSTMAAGDWGDSDETHLNLSAAKITQVIREKVTSTTEVYKNDTFKVGWGYWANGTESSTDNLGATYSNDSDSEAYWLSAKPTDINELEALHDAAIAQTGGILTYDTVLASQGSGFDSLNANITVDFGTGNLNGTFGGFLTDGTTSWSTSMSGNVSGATAQLTSAAGDIGGTAADTFSGSMHGVFVGTDAGGFANSFDFDATANSTNYDITGNSLLGITQQQ